MFNRNVQNWFSGGVTLLTLMGLLMAATPAAGQTNVRPGTIQGGNPATAASGRTVVRWSIGLGSGLDPSQIPVEQEVVDDFNASQDDIFLVMEFLPSSSPYDILANQMASGDAPDIIGPAGWRNAEVFHGQWLDLAPPIAASHYNTSKFDTSLVKMYQTDEGWIALPFAIFPSAMYYNKALFSAAGLNPLPAHYGDPYRMPDGTLVTWDWSALARVAKLLTRDSAGKHSGEAGFDASQIKQYGFSFGWETQPTYMGAFMSNGGRLLHGFPGAYTAQLPPLWKTAWQWVYDGIWGAEPYIPNADVASSEQYDYGNVFASGKIGMTDSPEWYLCCIPGSEAVDKFDFGSMPTGLDGAVAGRMDADTFRIWKGTHHPAQAFKALTYLIDTGVQKLLMGSPGRNGIYAGLPAQTDLRPAYIDSLKPVFPSVNHWDTLLAGINYPDKPSAESFLPNLNAAWGRLQSFGWLLYSTGGLDLAAEEATLQADLTGLFNQSSPPSGRTVVRWGIGLGTGADPSLIPTEIEVADDFNNSQDQTYLVPEVASNGMDVLAAELQAGTAPGLVGPAGWLAANHFHGHWLNMAPLIASSHFDTSIFTPGLVKLFHTDEGQVALPFAVYPSAVYYNPALFDKAGLRYPPAHYGDLYRMPNGSRVPWSWQTVAKVAKLLTLDINGNNATQAGFDPANIVQYGFSFGWETNPNYMGSYFKAGSILQTGIVPGSFAASVPAAWKDAFQWVTSGIWGKQPFIPNSNVSDSPDFDNSNVFASGKIAMLENPSWYLCCMDDLINAGGTFQLGAMPSYNGKVGGRMDQDTFRIVKGTPHPRAAFQALAYLVTTGVDKLLVGVGGNPPGYGNIPAFKASQAAYQDVQAARFPFVTTDSWNILKAGLKYPDAPSAEASLPNLPDAWDRLQSFGYLLLLNDGLALPNEEAKLEFDLGVIFNHGVSYIPGLQSPADGSALPVNRPVFDWTDVPKANRYEIQISRSATFRLPVTDVDVVPSTYTPAVNLPANQTLYWRVRARFAGGNGQWSPYFTLKTATH